MSKENYGWKMPGYLDRKNNQATISINANTFALGK